MSNLLHTPKFLRISSTPTEIASTSENGFANTSQSMAITRLGHCLQTYWTVGETSLGGAFPTITGTPTIAPGSLPEKRKRGGDDHSNDCTAGGLRTSRPTMARNGSQNDGSAQPVNESRWTWLGEFGCESELCHGGCLNGSLRPLKCSVSESEQTRQN